MRPGSRRARTSASDSHDRWPSPGTSSAAAIVDQLVGLGVAGEYQACPDGDRETEAGNDLEVGTRSVAERNESDGCGNDRLDREHHGRDRGHRAMLQRTGEHENAACAV